MEESEPTILYVDDEAPNRIVFEQNFRKRFNVVTASSGPEALELLKSLPVGVLVADQRMPEMSGNELLARVKTVYPSIIRVVITAYAELDPILSAVNRGLVARYVIKPWDRDELEEILLWCLEAYAIGGKNSAVQLRLLETERLVTLGSIGAAIVHDLNQPVSYMLLETERLQTFAKAAPALQRLVAAHAGELSTSEHNHLSELAAELPTISRDLWDGVVMVRELVRSTNRFTRRPVVDSDDAADPVSAIRFSFAVCNSLVGRHGGCLTYDGPQELPKVVLGQAELAQTLINIIANAAHALSCREGQAAGKIQVSACCQPGVVRFTVVDNGSGMSPEELQKVGKPFYTTRDGGTGLGLAQCRRLVEATGEMLEITSTKGEGTTVTFAVPVFDPNA